MDLGAVGQAEAVAQRALQEIELARLFGSPAKPDRAVASAPQEPTK